jgi:hypothetical protein
LKRCWSVPLSPGRRYDIDRASFAAKLDQLRAIQTSMIYSSHLPPAPGAMLDVFVESLAQAPDAPRFEGPGQGALEAMLAGTATAPV